MKQSLRSLLRVPPGPVDLSRYDPAATPLARADRDGLHLRRRHLGRLERLQRRLYADGVAGGSNRRLLLVLQGMDTSGKGGVTDHVVGHLRASGVRYTAFKAPTPEEQAHDFLWRIRRQLPAPGVVGVFDRSHYEDVLIVRVHDLVPADVVSARYGAINDFEAEATAGGTTIVKCFLHISPETQRRRLLARLDDPDKRWKFNPADVDERERWDDYVLAYETALERCNTPAAPWYVVPSDSKKYRNWAVTRLLLETLSDMDPTYPQPELDREALRARLARPDQSDARTNKATG